PTHDLITTGLDGCMILSVSGCGSGRGICPAIADRIISAAGVQVNVVDAAKSAPDNHFTARPDCCVISSASGRVGKAGDRPRVGEGVVSPAVEQIVRIRTSAPDNHFPDCPDSCVMDSTARPAND